MKRALKIASRKHDVPLCGKSPREKVKTAKEEHPSFQPLAHTQKNQSTVNALNELVLTISHYLNTPLTILLGKVELLSEATENGGMSKEEMKRFVDTCKREIFRIDAIVKAFQDLCRIQHKSYPPGVRMLDVEDEIKNRVKETSFLR